QAPHGEGGGSIFEEILGRVRGGRGARKPAGARPKPAAPDAELTIAFLTPVGGGKTTIQIDREGKRHTLEVKITPGTAPGNRTRLRGRGEPTGLTGERADLTIRITVEPRPYFKREGRNLSVEVPISVGEGVLGARIEVPTLDGLKTLPIPPGSS